MKKDAGNGNCTACPGDLQTQNTAADSFSLCGERLLSCASLSVVFIRTTEKYVKCLVAVTYLSKLRIQIVSYFFMQCN